MDTSTPTAPLLDYLVKHQCQQNKSLTINYNVATSPLLKTLHWLPVQQTFLFSQAFSSFSAH